MNMLRVSALGEYDTQNIFFQQRFAECKGGNRQNRLHLESRTPSWAGL